MKKEIIFVNAREFRPGKRGEEKILIGHGKFVIIKDGSSIPEDGEIAVEIIRELETVRFGKVFSGGVEAAREYQKKYERAKKEKAMKEIVEPLEEKFGKIDLPLYVGYEAKENGEVAIFSELYHHCLLHKAIDGSTFNHSGGVDIDMELAEKLWQEHANVEPSRARLWASVVEAYEWANRELEEDPEYLGRSFDFDRPTITPIKRLDLVLIVDGEEFPWSDEGVSLYKKALDAFVAEEKRNRLGLARARKDDLLAKMANGWLVGEHEVHRSWVAYHDGRGSHSEFDIASSGSNSSIEKGLIRISAMENDVYADSGDFISLTDEEYHFLISTLSTGDEEKNSLLVEWVRAHVAHQKKMSGEEESKRSPQGRFRWEEILRRLDEGWIAVKGCKSKKFGWILDETGGLHAIVPADEIKKVRHQYIARGTYGRTYNAGETLFVSPVFVELSCREYGNLPCVKITARLFEQAKKLREKLESNLSSSVEHLGEKPDYKFGDIISALRFVQSVPEYLARLTDADEHRKQIQLREEEERVSAEDRAIADSGLPRWLWEEFGMNAERLNAFVSNVDMLNPKKLGRYEHEVRHCGRAKVRAALISASGNEDFFCGADPNSVAEWVWDRIMGEESHDFDERAEEDGPVYSTGEMENSSPFAVLAQLKGELKGDK